MVPAPCSSTGPEGCPPPPLAGVSAAEQLTSDPLRETTCEEAGGNTREDPGWHYACHSLPGESRTPPRVSEAAPVL